MKIPSFEKFVEEAGDSIFQDAGSFRNCAEDSPVPFTPEQCEFLVDTIGSMVRSALERYHEWLSENLAN